MDSNGHSSADIAKTAAIQGGGTIGGGALALHINNKILGWPEMTITEAGMVGFVVLNIVLWIIAWLPEPPQWRGKDAQELKSARARIAELEARLAELERPR